jgi:hypothetical protein
MEQDGIQASILTTLGDLKEDKYLINSCNPVSTTVIIEKS